MSNIEELHARVANALARIEAAASTALDVRDRNAEMQAALDEEKTVTAQVEERLRRLKERQSEELAQATAQMQETRARVEALDLELQRMQKANAALREANAALRAANQEGVGDPHLINSSMLAELEALRAARAADIAETSAILSAMAPVLRGDEESADA